MEKIKKLLDENGLIWLGEACDEDVFRSVVEFNRGYGYSSSYMYELEKKEKKKWAREVIFSGLGEIKITNPRLLIEKMEVDESGPLDMEWFLENETIWIMKVRSEDEVGISPVVNIIDIKQDAVTKEKVIESFFPEYHIKKLFNEQEAESKLNRVYVKVIKEETEKIGKNKKLLNFLDEFVVYVIDQYEQYAKTNNLTW